MCSPDRSCTLRSGTVHDTIVVGAGPAGAAVAMLLARRGRRVVVLDHRPGLVATLPLTRAGVLLLSRWGLLDAVVAAGTPPVTSTTFRHGGESVRMSTRPSHGVDALYAPRRLGPLLVAAAIEAGAEVHHGAAVSDVVRRAGRVVGVRTTTPDRRVVELGAPLVVGADGTGSIIARQVRAPLSRRGQHASSTTASHRSGLRTDGYLWTFGREARTGMIPTAGGQALVFVSSPPVPGGHGRRGYIRRAHGPGWALVGAAGYFKDPLSAHGFTDPLRDAELLARAVPTALDDPASLDGALEGYEDERHRLGIPVFDVVDRIASHQWDDAELAGLLLRLSSAMADEVEALARLDVTRP